MEDYRKAYEEWLNDPYFDEGTRAELKAIENETGISPGCAVNSRCHGAHINSEKALQCGAFSLFLWQSGKLCEITVWGLANCQWELE